MRTLLCLTILFIICSCKSTFREVHILVRDEPRTLLDHSVQYELKQTEGTCRIEGQSTDFGYIRVDLKALRKECGLGKKQMLEGFELTVSNPENTTRWELNPYVEFYDLYLKPIRPVGESDRFADMHYHISMKAHNSTAQDFYGDNPHDPPATLLWMKTAGKLKVHNGKKWVKPEKILKAQDPGQLRKLFTNSDWIRSFDGANNLANYSQATFPHLADGNVYLAYNAISPFEHSISRGKIKQVVSSKFKSGADIKWLEIMGDKEDYLTHWENFNLEYEMMIRQDQGFNNLKWHYLRRRDSCCMTEVLKTPTVINVVEGAHILQDTLFPHYINYDIAENSMRDKQQLIKDRYNLDHRQMKQAPIQDYTEDYDDSLTLELKANIAALKEMDIFMIAIGHLSYNGMMGHSPAIDVSKKPPMERLISGVVKRAYSIRVSSDKSYRATFDGLFYTVPGVNKFGEVVIDELLDPTNIRMIPIDLKHSDVMTRSYVLDKYEELGEIYTDFSYEPICSHCAVTGLSMDYYSPLVNEYRLMEGTAARRFYPFGMNLYNEEVERICAANGIIGIPLEERVLGAYVDNRIFWDWKFRKKSGKLDTVRNTHRKRRWNYMKQVFRYLDEQRMQEYHDVLDYYRRMYGADVMDEDDLKDFLFEDYQSLEPFLQNVFHVVDIAHKVRKSEYETEAQKDSYDSLIKETPNILKGGNEDVRQEYARMEQREIEKSLEENKASLLENAWDHICIGSDLDGMIDPINVCPTASHYPEFKRKLEVFIPLFLYIRKHYEAPDSFLGDHRTYDDYFNASFKVKHALDKLFYTNLRDFTIRNINQ